MPENQPPTREPRRPGRKTLAGIVGATAAAILYVSIPEDEGTRHKAYRDIVGVWTICTGDTHDVRPGQVASRSECEARLERQLIAHAEPVMRCVPTLREDGRDNQRAAAVSLAYNIGTGGFCRSTAARRFNARDWRGGCDAMMAWNKVTIPASSVRSYRARGETCVQLRGGRWLCTVRGLTLRRQRERAICLRGL